MPTRLIASMATSSQRQILIERQMAQGNAERAVSHEFTNAERRRLMGQWLNYETEEQWLEGRRQHLTSTAMAAVAGVSKYETPLHVFRRFFNHLPVEENKYMRWGRLLQGVIAAEYERI